MNNQDISVARRYHQATKHSLRSIQSEPHYLDWNNRPSSYKEYAGLEALPLPKELPESGLPALQALEYPEDYPGGDLRPDLAQLAYLLYYSAGVTKILSYPAGAIEFRAAASAGALYPVEIYLVCGDLSGLEAGVYHFSPADFALRRLRKGDFRAVLAEASGGEPAVEQAPAVLVYTGITWRTAWKYRARSYRHHYWDGGTILANNLAACAALRLPARLVMGFVDGKINQLLGVDGEDEKSLALLPAGRLAAFPPEALEVPDLTLEVRSLSAEQREYPLIGDLHRASMLADPADVANWRSAGLPSRQSPPIGPIFPLEPLGVSQLSTNSLEDVIVKRGSSRRFRQEAISFSELSTILEPARLAFDADWKGAAGRFLNELYINVHAVDGLPAGSYRYHPESAALEQLESGDFRHQSAYLCLGQELGGTASATIFFLADLDAILERYGNRGYRIAQMEAGILGGKVYLGAYALGQGASGLTFFDDDVVNFFTPGQSGNVAIFVTAVGVPAPPRDRSGRLVYTRPGTGIRG